MHTILQAGLFNMQGFYQWAATKCFFFLKSVELAVVSLWRVLEERRKEQAVGLKVRRIYLVFLCWVSQTADRLFQLMAQPRFPCLWNTCVKTTPWALGPRCLQWFNRGFNAAIVLKKYYNPALSSHTHSAWLQIRSCIHTELTFWNLSDWCEKGWKGCFVEASFARLLIWNINNWSSFFLLGWLARNEYVCQLRFPSALQDDPARWRTSRKTEEWKGEEKEFITVNANETVPAYNSVSLSELIREKASFCACALFWAECVRKWSYIMVEHKP